MNTHHLPVIVLGALDHPRGPLRPDLICSVSQLKCSTFPSPLFPKPVRFIPMISQFPQSNKDFWAPNLSDNSPGIHIFNKPLWPWSWSCMLEEHHFLLSPGQQLTTVSSRVVGDDEAQICFERCQNHLLLMVAKLPQKNIWLICHFCKVEWICSYLLLQCACLLMGERESEVTSNIPVLPSN